MLKYSIGPLSSDAQDRLSELQRQIDSISDPAEKYAKASQIFSNKRNKLFEEIRSRLAKNAPSGDACYYCERDRFRDIDHVRPKRHYPQECFNWYNYVYACATCNQDYKGDTFAIIDSGGNLVEFSRQHPIAGLPPSGLHALVDIRSENPFEFLTLDFETGFFVPSHTGTVARARAKFTIRLLDLNHDNLCRIRRQAMVAFENYLAKYRDSVLAADTASAARRLKEITKLAHPTVLAEMRRQKDSYSWIPPLLEFLPETIGGFSITDV